MTVAATALGMITPVGWDAPTACASIRAGLVRAQPVDGFEVLDPEQQESVAVIGHPVAGYTDGFGMTARWNRLFDGAIDSLWATESVPPVSDVGFWRDTGLMVVTP